MTISLVIQRPEPVAINTFVLIVKYMHGDADAYTAKEFKFRDDDGREYDLLLKNLEALSHISGGQDWDDVEEILEEAGFEQEFVGYFTDNIYESDSTREGEGALIKNFEVVYYSAEGQRCPVKVVNEDKNER